MTVGLNKALPLEVEAFRLVDPGEFSGQAQDLGAEVRKLLGELDKLASRLSCIDTTAAAGPKEEERATQAVALAVAVAKQTIKMRRQRAKLFGVGLFAEPGWDILLELYVAKAEDYKVTVGNACIAASVPMSSALRWCQLLEDRRIILRYQDTGDRRRRFVKLSDCANEKMTQLLVQIARQ